MLGGFLLGLAEVLFVGLLPPIYSAYRDAFVFSTLILILLVLPNGLSGQIHGGAGMSDAMNRAKLLPLLLLALGAAAVWIMRSFMDENYLSIFNFVGINIILAVSLNLTNGFTGLFSLGHPGFMAVGGYVTAILTFPAGRKAMLLPALPGWLAAPGVGPSAGHDPGRACAPP